MRGGSGQSPDGWLERNSSQLREITAVAIARAERVSFVGDSRRPVVTRKKRLNGPCVSARADAFNSRAGRWEGQGF
jgi:hypothetical protein